MLLTLRQLADLDGEVERVAKTLETEFPPNPLDTIHFFDLPLRHLRSQLRDLRVGQRGHAAAARHAGGLGETGHMDPLRGAALPLVPRCQPHSNSTRRLHWFPAIRACGARHEPPDPI